MLCSKSNILITYVQSDHAAQLRQFHLLPQAFQYGFAYAYKVQGFMV